MPNHPLPRIAFVSGRLEMGGASTFVCNLAGELVRLGIPCLVVNFSAKNGHAEDFAQLGIKVLSHDMNRELYEDVIASVLDQLAEFQATAVVANLDSCSYEVLRQVPSGVNRIAICHSADSSLYRSMAPFAPWFDDIVGVSEHVAKALRDFPPFHRARIHYLSCGVNVPEKAPVRTFDPDTPLRIIYFGRLEQDAKRVRLFPHIFKQLVDSGIPFHWTITGDGSERAFLEENMKSISAFQGVEFTGSVAYQHIPDLLQKHDVYLLTSDYEGGPLSLLEAMAYGLVPVTSDLPTCIRQAVDPSTGVLVQPDNIEGYAAGIIYLHYHRAAAASLSVCARERVRSDFSIQTMTQKWLDHVFTPQETTGNWQPPYQPVIPLGADGRFQFSALGRVLRRLLHFFR